MQSPVHCLNLLLPPKKITDYKLRIAIMFYLNAVLMFLNDLLLIGPSLVYNVC